MTADLKNLIATAKLRGAVVHTTRDGDRISTVQVIGMPGISAFPLPAHQATTELRAAVGEPS